jgi:hypothetical protein
MSPGVTGAKSLSVRRRLVVVDDFDFIGIAIPPFENQPPLIVYADRY